MEPLDEIVDIREDISWITDEYLSLALHMVAHQFINENGQEYPDQSVFVERATYLLRQHCPIAYSYFFTQVGVETLPFGSQMIIVELVRKQRPLFLMGMVPGDTRIDA